MTKPNELHRPVTSGLRIESAKMVNGVPEYTNFGTLTGLATRNSDGAKVLVTNKHVMTNDPDIILVGGEEMYQPTVARGHRLGKLVDDPNNPSHLPIEAVYDNIADIAYCLLDEDVETEFAMHDDGSHTNRLIAGKTKEPRPEMELTVLGAIGGEGVVTVCEVNQDLDMGGWGYKGITILDGSKRPIKRGDSGAPCLFRVKDDLYFMSCILFAKETLDDTIGYAFPASVAEKELGITFGNTPPGAYAGSDQTVHTNETVTLNGSVADVDEHDKGKLVVSWKQTSGTTVTLSDATIAKPTFKAPNKAGELEFLLSVTDIEGETATDSVTIKVIWKNTKWARTFDFCGCGPTRREKFTRLWEGELKTEWRDAPEPLVWSSWADTGKTRGTKFGQWQDTGHTKGSGLDRQKKQSRTKSFEKEQRSTNQCKGEKFQYQPVSITQTRWLSDPKKTPPTPWTNTGIERKYYTVWSDTGKTTGCGPSRKKEQSREFVRETQQRRYDENGKEELRTKVTKSPGGTRWVSSPESLRWSSWSDTGRRKEHEYETGVMIKEQKRTSQCGDVQYQWTYA